MNGCIENINSIVNGWDNSSEKENDGKSIDILINCAGSGKWKFIEETSYQEAYDMMALPYFAAFNMTRALIPGMLRERSGLIVNINSPVSFQSWPGCLGYACSRYALKGFTESLRMDLKGTGVNVMEVIPGETDSNYFKANNIGNEHFPTISSYFAKITPEDVGKVTVAGIVNNRSTVITPFSLVIVKRFGLLFPGVLRFILGSTPRGNKRIELIKTGKLNN
eukprot:gene10303-12642_t